MNRLSIEVMRYAVNGIVATGIHYTALTINLQVLSFPSAGLANLVAAVFGIAASFLGNRYFVFRRTDTHIATQALKFGSLYAAIALLHGLVLTLWTDWLAQDYRFGFLIATGLQLLLSYVGNKNLVFKS